MEGFERSCAGEEDEGRSFLLGGDARRTRSFIDNQVMNALDNTLRSFDLVAEFEEVSNGCETEESE